MAQNVGSQSDVWGHPDIPETFSVVIKILSGSLQGQKYLNNSAEMYFPFFSFSLSLVYGGEFQRLHGLRSY